MKREQGIWYEHMDHTQWTAEYPKCSMFMQFKKSAQLYSNLPAIVFENKQYTFKQLLFHIEHLAKALISINIKPGDIVSIISPNTPQAVMMIYALNRIGATANLIHPLLSPTEIQHFVESTDSAAVFILDVIYDKIASIHWKMNTPPKVIIAKITDALPLYLKLLYPLKAKKPTPLNVQHNNIYWHELLKNKLPADASLPPEAGDPEAIAAILYSGGTTGLPKGVMLTNYNLTCYAIQAFEASGMNAVGKRCLGVLPLFHGFGLALCVHTMLCAGTCVYLVPTYDFKKCNTLIFKKKLNFLCGVPAFFESLSRYPDMEGKNLSFIECLISGGDVLSERLQRRINKQLAAGGSAATIREAYGQTESVTGCCINPVFQNIIGSVGLPCPDIASKIVEIGTCNEVPNGTDGELCLTGPNLMRGYYKNEAATEQVLKRHKDEKTWLHTGDIFTKNDEGYLFFRQRLARMIVCAGYNVYLSQIEHVLTDCDLIEECCAVGINDKVLGSKVGLFVILRSSMDHQEARKIIMDFCKSHMAEFALPYRVAFIDEFPRTKMGKVDFMQLEKLMLSHK